MPSPRRAKAPLSRERIELAALALVEEDGLEQLSMRRLGERLRCEAMSLYHHFPSKAHLLDALLDRVLAPMTWPEDALPWRRRVEAIARAWRAALRRHPRFAPHVLVHRLNTRGALLVLERAAAPFYVPFPEPARAARAFRAFSYYLTGALLDETAGYAAGPSAADPVPLEEQAAIAPGVLRMGPYFTAAHWDRTFEHGLGLLLDGLEREARRPRAR